MEVKEEEVPDYKQNHARCTKCSQRSDMPMRDRKMRATRVSVLNTLVISGHNNLKMLDIAEK